MNWGMFAAGLVLGFFSSLFFGDVLIDDTRTVFSPEGGQDIIDFVNSAKESIDIEVYVFTSRDIVDALERAKRRGVKIRILLERDVIGNDNDEIYAELLSKGFSVRFASQSYQLTHSKFIIIDGNTVLAGSHNLSNSALFKNREASIITSDRETVSEFREVFETDWKLSLSG